VCVCVCVCVRVCVRLCVRSYHAVTSWSRVKGMGIPLWKAAEVTLIWLVAVALAVPEALAFDMMELPYRGNKLRVCLLHPEQTSDFMKVRAVVPGGQAWKHTGVL